MQQKDLEIIQKVLEGDREAFGSLVKKYQKGIHALAWRKIGDFHIAQEITQDAFIKAYHKLDTLKNHNLFAGWLYVIAANLCSDWLQKNSQALKSLEPMDADVIDYMSYSRYIAEKQAAETDETRREIVKRLLQKLPESERTVITLYYFGEMTCETIGKLLGVSPNTIKSRLSRARNRLKKEEDMIRQSLDSFQLPICFTENIMREISRIALATPAAKKPVAPWVISAASAALMLLFIGVGTYHFSRFQKPYNLNATSEPTVELIEARFVLDTPAKPAARNQLGNSTTSGKNAGAGQKPDAPLFAAVAADEAEIATPEPQWIQTQGPEGGRVLSLFETTAGDLYAGTAAGLYRFTEGERAWKLMTNSTPEAHIAYNLIGWWPMTEHRDALYFATDTVILASTDRGETWNTLGTHPKGLPIGIVITDGVPVAETNISIYLALTDGIYRSEDSGKSWILLKDGLANRKIRALVAVENTVLAGTDDGLYRFDAGIWKRLSLTHTDGDGQKVVIHALAAAGHRLYAVVGKQATSKVGGTVKATMIGDTWWALYRSTDLGNTWYAVNPRKKLGHEKSLKDGSVIVFSRSITNLEEGHAGYEIDLITHIQLFASAAKVMVTDRQHQFYSIDTGETWFSLDSQATLYDRLHALPVVMRDANTFYIGMKSGIHHTADSGKSWLQFNTGIVSTDVTNLVAANGKLYAKTTNGIMISTDGGESWTMLPIGVEDITDIAEFDGSIYARGEKNWGTRFFRLSANEDSLIFIPGIPPFKKVTADQQAWLNKRLNPFRGALTEKAKQNFKIDELLNLEDYDPDKLSAALEKSFHDSDTILAISRSGDYAVSNTAFYVEHGQKLLRWKPGTTGWYDTRLIEAEKRTPQDQSNKASHVPGFQVPAGLTFAVSGRTVYVGTGNGTLLQSFDEGDTWNNVTANLPFPISRFKIITFAGSTVYVATGKGVLYSRDGTDWHGTTDVDGTKLVIDKLAIDDTTVYGVSDIHVHPARHVYQLKAGATIWKQVTPEIPNRVTSLAVDRNTLYLGTIGRGVLRFTLDKQ